jgi:hypothetical protein
MKSYCKYCESSIFSDYLSIGGYSYKRCKKCKLVQLVPMPSDKELYEFYSENYYLKNYNFDDVDRAKVIASHTQAQYEIVKQNFKFESNTKFLDFGCGTGAFLDVLSENDHSFIFGHEFNKAAELVILRKGYKHVSNLEESKETFDVISLWDVAEHLTDPVTTFTLLFKKLNKNGILVIGTSRIDDFVDKTSFGYTMWADVPGHTLLYSKNSLKNILQKSGFSIISVDEKHSISNIWNSKTLMLKRLIKKIVFFYMTDRKIKQDKFGSYLVIIAKK